MLITKFKTATPIHRGIYENMPVLIYQEDSGTIHIVLSYMSDMSVAKSFGSFAAFEKFCETEET